MPFQDLSLAQTCMKRLPGGSRVGGDEYSVKAQDMKQQRHSRLKLFFVHHQDQTMSINHCKLQAHRPRHLDPKNIGREGGSIDRRSESPDPHQTPDLVDDIGELLEIIDTFPILTEALL